MNIYGVYDTKRKEQCVRIGTLQEIIKFFNMSARLVQTAIKAHRKIEGRYELVYLFKEDNI